MKQSEKSKLTYDKILRAAVAEFGTNSYANASVNSICSNDNISKGLVYHNFKNKDELYLACVDKCFREIAAFLTEANYDSANFKENIEKLMGLRNQFFRENPYYSKIFFDALLVPPKHLAEEIQNIKKEFDHFNVCQYQKIIQSVTLRDDISEEEALEYFFIFGEMFNGYFGSKAYQTTDFSTLVNEHEMKLSKILSIILYGIVKEE